MYKIPNIDKNKALNQKQIKLVHIVSTDAVVLDESRYNCLSLADHFAVGDF